MIHAALVFFLFCSSLVAADPPPPAPKTTAELDQALRKVLVETKTPGVGVSVVAHDRVLWTAGIGKADVAKGIEVTPDTLFRIGSVSKSIVSLSILKLEEQGKLHLTDTARSLAPEIPFSNPWESTDPVRIVNLLEHTTGFDDLHFSEYANNDPHAAHSSRRARLSSPFPHLAMAARHFLFLLQFRAAHCGVHRGKDHWAAF
jgi:CubicO group peptidase (beta-lactamase class C family)